MRINGADKVRVNVYSPDMRQNMGDRWGLNKNRNRNKPIRQNTVIVTAYNKNNEVIDRRENTNLVVYHGRSWAMQKLMGTPLISQPEHRSQYPNMNICLFALGSGGCIIENDQLYVIPVKLVDYKLDNHLLAVPGSEVPDDVYRYTVDGTSYDFMSFTSIEYVPDPDVVPGDDAGIEDPDYEDMEDITVGGKKADSYLLTKIHILVPSDYYNGDGSEPQPINEAGLFFNVLENGEPSENYFPQLYAKVHFSSIMKTDSIQLAFEWYLLF